jgi:prophage regulatory protein
METFLDKTDLEATGIRWSNVHLRRLEAAGKFPRRVPIGENTTGWIQSEIETWQQARIAERDAPASAQQEASAESMQGPQGSRRGRAARPQCVSGSSPTRRGTAKPPCRVQR